MLGAWVLGFGHMQEFPCGQASCVQEDPPMTAFCFFLSPDRLWLFLPDFDEDSVCLAVPTKS